MKRDVESLPALIDAVVEATQQAHLGLIVTVDENDDPHAVYANEAALLILGATEDQIIGMPSFLNVAPEEQARMRDLWARRAAGEAFEVTIVRRDNGVRVPLEVGMSRVDYAGKPAAVAFFQDITARRRALEQLTASEARFRRLIEVAPEAIAVTLADRFLYVNPAYVRMLGYDSRDALLAVPLRELVHGDDLERAAARRREMLAGNAQVLPREYRVYRKDGRLVEVEVSSILIDYDGARAALSFARDVTERNRTNAQLAQTDRLAALGVLAAGVAHEINNPLAYVMLNLSRSLEDLAVIPGAETVIPYLQETLGGVERVATIARDLSAFARQKPEVTGPVDVQRVLESALKMSAHEIGPRARLVTSWKTVPAVIANESRLAQVFVNLLVNAAHAIPEGDPARHRVEVTIGRNGDRVVVDITDTGTGIAPEDRGRIFDPFFTTKRIGTGLGLSICHSIITGLGGDLSVTSEAGRGSTFRVALPIAGDKPAASAPPPIRRPARRASILIVDDEVALLQALKAILSDANDVTVATTGTAALALVDTTPFDLILCDLMMSPVTGMDVYRELDSRGLADRIVFMTGGTYTPAARDFLATIENPRIAKPFDLEALERLIADHLK